MTRLILVTLLSLVGLSGASMAGERISWGQEIWLELQDSLEPDAVAQVAFMNGFAHTDHETYDLDRAGVSVRVQIISNGDKPDTLSVFTDDTHFAWPVELNCADGDLCVVQIYPLVAEVG